MYGGSFEEQDFIRKEDLLLKVSQIEIMERYLGIRVSFNKSVKNPLRSDKSPGCRFYVSNGKLKFIDFSKRFNEDCFGVVMHIYSCGFNEAINIIAKDFNITSKPYKEQVQLDTSSLEEQEEASKNKSYLYELMTDIHDDAKWLSSHKDYWRQYRCITPNLLKELNIYPLNTLWIDNRIVYQYSPNDIGFIYLFPDDTFKCYFPLRDKSSKFTKFISTGNYLQGYNSLPEEGGLLVITKSMKDILCLRAFGISAIAPHTEIAYLDDNILDDLEERFENIVTLYDFDLAGIIGANRLYKSRGYMYCFLTNGRFYTEDYKAKDISDYLKMYGKNRTESLINNIRDTYLI